MSYGALRRFRRIRDVYKCFCLAAVLSLTVTLTGCGNWLFDDSSAGKSSQSTQDIAPPPPGSQASAGMTASPANSPASTNQTVAPTYVSSYVDPLLETPPMELTPNGSLGSLGLNLDTYFAHNLDGMHTNEARISRLERVLTAMQKDLRRMAPPIQRLISIESDIKALVTQLSQLAQAEPETIIPEPVTTSGTAPPQPPPSAAPVPVTPAISAPSQSGGKTVSGDGNSTVKRVRLGEHPDKTRIVLDVSGPATYRYDLDNSENLLVIELPDASWSANTQWQGSKSPLLSSYSAAAAGSSGSRLVIQLKESATVTGESVIKENGYPDYRIVIDLKGVTVHK